MPTPQPYRRAQSVSLRTQLTKTQIMSAGWATPGLTVNPSAWAARDTVRRPCLCPLGLGPLPLGSPMLAPSSHGATRLPGIWGAYDATGHTEGPGSSRRLHPPRSAPWARRPQTRAEGRGLQDRWSRADVTERREPFSPGEEGSQCPADGTTRTAATLWRRCHIYLIIICTHAFSLIQLTFPF